MKTTQISIGIKWPFKLADFQNGNVEISEVIEIEEGDDLNCVVDEKFEEIKCFVQNKIGQAMEEWLGYNPNRPVRRRNG